MNEEIVFSTRALSVGYRGKALVRDIDIDLRRGQILSLIGPNGAGKSTILKPITGQIPPISGTTVIEGKSITAWPRGELARKMAVVLTDRIRPEMMTCFDVAAMGRYPYTGRFGSLTDNDRAIVHATLRRVRADDLADRDFSQISDGQRQRIMLARALCQEPEVIVLDEPTSYLDIRHKAELLDILSEEARAQQRVVVMSMHEISLAEEASDLIMTVHSDGHVRVGKPAEMLSETDIAALFDMDLNSRAVRRFWTHMRHGDS